MEIGFHINWWILGFYRPTQPTGRLRFIIELT